MVKVVEGGQFAATRARFSPGMRTGLHLVAAEATDTPSPIAIETAKTSQSLFMSPLLPRCSPYQRQCHHSSTRQRPIRVVFASAPMRVPSLPPHVGSPKLHVRAWGGTSPLSPTSIMPVDQACCEFRRTPQNRSPTSENLPSSTHSGE